MARRPLINLELYPGRWEDVLGDVDDIDTLIADPPYTDRTIKGTRSGSKSARSECGTGYDAVDETWCRNFVAHWHPRTRGWMVIC